MNELDGISQQYLDRPPDRQVDSIFIDAIAEHVIARLAPRGTVIELGLGDRVFTPRLLRHFDEVISVDGSKTLVEAVRAEIDDPRWTGVVSYFEDFSPSRQVDAVLATGVLEHVDHPELVLRRVRSWLGETGTLVVTVPNGESLHRQLACILGIADDPTVPGEADIRLGHKHVFTLDRLMSIVESSGFVAEEVEGLLAKTLPNGLMVGCSEAQLRGLVQLGRALPPRLSGTLYVKATVR
jgi:SAM-dependent methyltransferase